MPKKTLSCIGGCGDSIEVYGETTVAYACLHCLNPKGIPSDALICDRCTVRIVTVGMGTKSVTCSHCVQAGVASISREDELDRSEVTGTMVKATLKKLSLTQAIAAEVIAKKFGGSVNQADMSRAVTGKDIPKRPIVDWVRKNLTQKEMDACTTN